MEQYGHIKLSKSRPSLDLGRFGSLIVIAFAVCSDAVEDAKSDTEGVYSPIAGDIDTNGAFIFSVVAFVSSVR